MLELAIFIIATVICIYALFFLVIIAAPLLAVLLGTGAIAGIIYGIIYGLNNATIDGIIFLSGFFIFVILPSIILYFWPTTD